MPGNEKISTPQRVIVERRQVAQENTCIMPSMINKENSIGLDWDSFCAAVNAAALTDSLDDLVRNFEGKLISTFGVVCTLHLTDDYNSVGIDIGKREFTDSTSNVLVFNYALLKPSPNSMGDWQKLHVGDHIHFKGIFVSNPMRRFIDLQLYPDHKYYAEITISDAVLIQ